MAQTEPSPQPELTEPSPQPELAEPSWPSRADRAELAEPSWPSLTFDRATVRGPARCVGRAEIRPAPSPDSARMGAR